MAVCSVPLFARHRVTCPWVCVETRGNRGPPFVSGFLLVSPVNPPYVPQGETIPCFWPVFLLGFPKKTNSQPLTFGLPANQISQLKSVWGRPSSVFPHKTRGIRRAPCRNRRSPVRGSLQPRRQRKLAFQARRRRQQEEAGAVRGSQRPGAQGAAWFLLHFSSPPRFSKTVVFLQLLVLLFPGNQRWSLFVVLVSPRSKASFGGQTHTKWEDGGQTTGSVCVDRRNTRDLC